MGLQIKNGYLLLEEAESVKSVFAQTSESYKYKVAFADGNYKPGDFLYLRPGAGEPYKVGENEYTLAQLEDVVAHEA